MKKQKEEIEGPSAPFWMTTYSDMVTLLLVFFILILSYSTIELEKFKGAMSSMKGALGILESPGSVQKKQDVNFREKMTARYSKIQDQINEFKTIVNEMNLDAEVDVEYSASGIHIRLGDRVLFDLGKAEIKNNAYPILSQIADIIDEDVKINSVQVEGHTDNIPINTSRYPSNWELSTARALSVVKYLHERENIEADKLAAVGHGEHRPLEPNTSPENRARNRRVEIFIKMD